MNAQEYIKQKKEFYHNLMEYFDDEENDDLHLIGFYIIENFEELKQQQNKDELKILLHLILKIANNHQPTPSFHKKIDQIIIYFADQIKQTFLNSELFDLFKENKRILLHLFQNQIIKVDKYIFDFIYHIDSYCYFFILKSNHF